MINLIGICVKVKVQNLKLIISRWTPKYFSVSLEHIRNAIFNHACVVTQTGEDRKTARDLVKNWFIGSVLTTALRSEVKLQAKNRRQHSVSQVPQLSCDWLARFCIP